MISGWVVLISPNAARNNKVPANANSADKTTSREFRDFKVVECNKLINIRKTDNCKTGVAELITITQADCRARNASSRQIMVIRMLTHRYNTLNTKNCFN